MAWQYFVICLFDFMIAPMMYTAIQTKSLAALTQWDPITLRGGGVYHIAMGAIVGIYTWSRGQEKIQMFRDQTYGSDIVASEYMPTTDSDDDIFVPPSKRRGV